jgi:TM2 domain-containing membrane protein YozV
MAMNKIKSFTHQDKSNKSKSIAFWLCIIFGPFGLHRLYVGRMISGLCMLVPSVISSFWIYKKYDGLSDTLNAALAGTDQTQQLNNLYSALDAVNQKAAATSSSWDGLLSWVTFGLLIWAIIDLIMISSGKFKDGKGRTL